MLSKPGSTPPDFVASYASLFEQHQTELIRYLYSLLGEVETARDLAQETFLRGYRLWLENPERTGWRPLLYKIATNCALDLLRRRTRIHFISWPDESEEQVSQTNSAAEEASAFSEMAEQVEQRSAILEALRGLDIEAATCLLLHYDQGFSCAEIASMTDTSLQATWQRLSRARRLFCSLYRKEQAREL